MKQEFQVTNFKQQSLDMIERVNDIVQQYSDMGYELTLRQVYYQLVSKDIIPNNERSYDNLGALVSKGRLSGLIDWEAITDRTRNLKGYITYNDIHQFITKKIYQYHVDKWEDQEYHVEVWVEKDALVDIVGQAARKYQVDYFSCRGYTSLSSMYEAAERLKYYSSRGKNNIILHLGDHDPSGIDMTRDIESRLHMFGSDTEIHRLALNMNQVDEYEPPPNPAKLSDSRCKGYIEKYGSSSWELDALKPQVIDEVITENIKKYLDTHKYMKAERREKYDREKMRVFARKMRDEE
jgi:hypothetical protein